MEQVENNYNLRSDFATRLAATLLDIFTICLLSFIFFMFGLASIFTGLTLSNKYANNSFMSGALAGGGFGTMVAMLGLIYLVVLLYGLIEAFTGASPGKRMLGLKIAHENGTQGNLNLYFKRWLFKNIGHFLGLTTFLASVGNVYDIVIVIGCFWVLGEKKQAFHDMWAKTAVFRKKDIVAVENTSL